MGVEVVESNAALNVETVSDTKVPAENGKVSIMFGSHGGEEPKAEANKVSESSLPKDAVDEWPEPKQIHSFYAVRYRPIEDQNVRAKQDVYDRELQKLNQARAQKVDQLKAKRAERSVVMTQLRTLGGEKKQFNSIMDEKRKEMEPLQQALGKLRGGSGGGRDGRDRGMSICTSEAELNDVIKSRQYRIQHESIPLTEEKQILREIKQLEGTRPQVIAYAAERAKIQEAMGEKDAIQDQVKLIGVGLDGVRKERQGLSARIKELEDQKAVIEKEIGGYEEELTALTEKRDKKYEQIKDLRKQREDGNSPFYENRKMLSSAKELAAKKDVEALKELVNTEVEKFMTLWNSKKAFRDDYEKRILPSLDMRQLSRDGRQRNYNEKPLMQVDVPTPPQPEVVKASSKPAAKESIIPPAQVEASAEQKSQKVKPGKSNKEGNKKTEINKADLEDEEEVFTLGNTLPSNSVTKSDEVVDEKKLKEQKREEEIAKRTMAEERKKKLAEKAAAKAAIKAQKEAEKKLKEREKRARKKSGVAGAPAEAEEPTEAVAEVAEEEKIEEKIETVAPQKSKERKETSIRSRARARGPDSLPKAILKRKKATNYWLYAGSAAAVVLLVLIAVGYTYLA